MVHISDRVEGVKNLENLEDIIYACLLGERRASGEATAIPRASGCGCCSRPGAEAAPRETRSLRRKRRTVSEGAPKCLTGLFRTEVGGICTLSQNVRPSADNTRYTTRFSDQPTFWTISQQHQLHDHSGHLCLNAPRTTSPKNYISLVCVVKI